MQINKKVVLILVIIVIAVVLLLVFTRINNIFKKMENNSSDFYNSIKSAADKFGGKTNKDAVDRLEVYIKKRAESEYGGSSAENILSVIDSSKWNMIRHLENRDNKDIISPCGGAVVVTGYTSTHRGGEVYYIYDLFCGKSYRYPLATKEFSEISEPSFETGVE